MAITKQELETITDDLRVSVECYNEAYDEYEKSRGIVAVSDGWACVLRHLGHIEGVRSTLEALGYRVKLVYDQEKPVPGPITSFDIIEELRNLRWTPK